MQVFDNRIYFGHGNSSNNYPSTNAGPIPLVYYDPKAGQFVTQSGMFGATPKTSLDDEQIDLIKVFNGKLVVPGHDSRAPDGFDQGNWYDLASGAATWTKHRNISLAIHTFDMAYFNGRMFAAVSRSVPWTEGDWTTSGVEVMMSADNGTTWTKLGTIQNDSYINRCYTFFELGGFLYATQEYYSPLWDNNAFIARIDSGFTFTQVAINTSNLFPSVSFDANDPDMKIYKPVNFLGKAVYLAGFTYNDQQMLPKAIVALDSLTSSFKVTLPSAAAIPMDLLLRGNDLYALAYIREGLARYKIIVYKTSDLINWAEVVSFYHETFARSFEELNGDLYLGLGCNTEYLPGSTGTILRVKNAVK
jgi:hypothetical protein